uniref:Pancreatic trypsin inhibitor n=1 Tax=Rhipicephalus appendiculatus TaxID=34631 RepID=A0A131Z206_RHIAP
MGMSSYCLLIFILVPTQVLGAGNPTALKLLRRLWRFSCEEPINEPVGDCTATINKYFFNHTAQMCQKFYWNGCLTRGVYETRYACALNCHEGEDPLYCAAKPPCECRGSKSMSWGQRYYEIDVFYYDINERKCKPFKYCGPPLPPESNMFTSLSMCIMECEGFPFSKAE